MNRVLRTTKLLTKVAICINITRYTQIIRARRSIRKYTSESVACNQLEAMIGAARHAPSAKNRQPWKYIVYMEKSKAELLDVMEKALINEQKEHALLPKSAWALPDAFHTLEIMRNAPAVIIVMNPDGKSPYGQLDADARLAEISDSLSIGASIENMLLKATELGLGTLWIANTCFAYNDLMEFINSPGQLIGAVAVGYADEKPNPRPRKEMGEILEYRD